MAEADHPELASGAEAAREIVACAERSLSAASARIELHQELSFPGAEWPGPRGRRGLVLRLAGRLAKRLAKAAWRHAARRVEANRGLEFGHFVGEGIAEPARARYMIDYGSFAELHAEGRTLGGRSGRPLRDLHPLPGGGRVGEVLWLLRLLPGITDAALEGSDTLHGAACRRFSGTVDLARASAASGEGLASPQVERFEELRALPVTVWIDGQHLRRIRFEQVTPARHLTTLDLWEFGVPVENLDWSRLPTFRSPGYEQEPKPWYQRVLRRRERGK